MTLGVLGRRKTSRVPQGNQLVQSNKTFSQSPVKGLDGSDD